MTKIMHVIIGLDVGGAERALLRLVSARVPSRPYAHMVVALTDRATLAPLFRDSGVPVHILNMGPGGGRVLRTFIGLRRLMAENKCDIIQCWMYHADLLGGLAALSLGNKNIIWGIRNSKLEAGGTFIKRALRRVCAALSYLVPKQVVCVAESARQAHVAVGYDSAKMRVIPNGFDLDEFRPNYPARVRIREEFKFGDNDVVIGSVGRYSAAKDHAGFLAAASLVAATDDQVRFLLVGRDVDDTNEQLSRLVSQYGLNGQVHLAGERNDIAECMAAMDVFCLHSQTEGFPNVLGEAMSSALAVVSTDVGDAREIVGACGHVIEAGDIHALSQAMIDTVRMSAFERARRGAMARARIEEKYSFSRVISDYDTLYGEIND